MLRNESLCIVIIHAALRGWVIDQTDFTPVFLNVDLEEEVCVEQPQGYHDGTGRVWRLKKAMYGLKQAPRAWNKTLNALLGIIGFTPTLKDPCVECAATVTAPRQRR